MNYIVTGGLGFIGYHLSKRLLNDGHEVVIFDNFRNKEYSEKNAVKLLNKYPGKCYIGEADICNLSYYDNVLTKIDGIFHLAAIPRVSYSIDNPVETSRTNIDGTVEVLEYARRNKIPKVIFASSSSVYGDNSTPFRENFICYPKSPYAIQKLTGEMYMEFYNDYRGVKTQSLRFFNVYGPNQDENHPYALLIPKAISCALKDEPIPIYGDGENARDFTYVDDVVEACVLVMEADDVLTGDVFNVGAENPHTVNEVLDLIQKHLPDKDITINRLPPRVEPKKTYADSTLLNTVFTWTPKTDIETGIINCIKDMRGELE
jgi:nucleoside-diphosphate-sugar epimerase